MPEILITGGAGFIGSNAAMRFLNKGYKVVLVDNLSRKGAGANLEWLRSAGGDLVFEKGDVRDFAFLQGLMEKYNPAAVLHLAAQVAVTTSVEDPRMDFEINALGTFNLLEAVRASGKRPAFLFASTNKVYGAMEDIEVVERAGAYAYESLPFGVDETRQLDFHSPYGCSKGAADQYVLDYARIYGLPTVVFRQSCIYGTRQFGIEDQGWVAWFVIAAVLGRPITIYGDGKQVRDVLFVGDLVELYERAIENIDRVKGEAFNVGGGPHNTLSLLQLLEKLAGLLDRRISVSYSDWRPGDQKVFVADIRKAKAMLGWEPSVSPDEGVSRLLRWVQDNRRLFEDYI
jgi:CDP-paratose 2-epimerase